MKLLRAALLMSAVLVSSACGGSKSVDPSALFVKLAALNERACACKDEDCAEAAFRDHILLQEEVRAVDKNNKEHLSKLAELREAFFKCVGKELTKGQE